MGFSFCLSSCWQIIGYRDNGNGANDNSCGDPIHESEFFVGQSPAQKDCNDWIDISIGRGQRRGSCLQQPNIGAESDQGTEEDQVNKRKQRTVRDMTEVE